MLSDIYLDIYICQWVRAVMMTAQQDVPIYPSPATVRVRPADATSLVHGPGYRLPPVRQLVNPAATRRSTPLADWPIRALPPTGQPPYSVRPPLAAAAAQPTEATQPTGAPPPPLPALPRREPLWHHRAARGLPGVGYPPGARPSTTPARAGVVHNRPRDTATPP